jgi:crotonobetainyl-CoA:carnitine CoA-transferase CaiB-like acyl-CoA transferase
MALSGPPGGTPRLAPAPLAARARALVAELARRSGSAELAALDGAALLGERAACLGLERRGRVAPGGSCRLVRAADGWLALNLSRADDRALLPAWLGEEPPGADPWPAVKRGVAREAVAALVARARLLGLAAAPAGAPEPGGCAWLRLAARGPRGRPAAGARPLVLDLSSLWAGPLATHLLRSAGARVVKLESRARPDGARFGSPAFFDLLHAGKASVALDFDTREGRSALAQLVERADVVVEASRPRALAQLGIDANDWVAARPGRTWIALSGYGRREPAAGWVAFGDDAAAAAGLAAATGEPDSPLFCGDAIADPLTGMHAALAAWCSWRRGGGALLDLSLCGVVASVLAEDGARTGAHVRRAGSGWEVATDDGTAPVATPRARRPRGRARPLGADTRRVLRELGAAC